MKAGYVDLSRRFVPFHEIADSDEAAWLSYYRPAYTDRRSIDWEGLIADGSRCAVVLGEAGSGKSWEFEAQAEILHSRGVTAFFLPLEDLADQAIDRCFKRDDDARLKHWLDGTDRAVFFLDSLDEARLKDRHALRKALRALDRGLGQSLKRACIVLSCRVSDWQPTSDLQSLQPFFGNPDTDKDLSLLRRAKKTVLFRIVQLAPLDRNQVGILAKARGVEPVDQFLRDIDEADAWAFTGRPRDAEDLIGFWKQHRKLGSLTELIEQNLERKLREARISDDRLESTKARCGAERLAAATVLCRKNTFLVPDEAIGSDSIGSSIDPTAILPDFQASEHRALLARPIFDEATYGRVRFHHRTVREYLVALWLRRLLEQGCRPEIEDLFFHRKHGRQFIAPSLLPVAAWVSSFDPDLQRRLLETEPLALVQHGDAENIDPLDRASMVGKLAIAYAKQSPVWLDASALRRFAHDCFASKINELLRGPGLSQHSKYFLLLLIWHGRVTGCTADAFELAVDPAEEIEIRSVAVRAVGATADGAMLGSLGEYALKSSDLPRPLAGSLFDALYPRAFGVDGLVELIKRVHGGDGRPSDAPTFSLTQIFTDGGKNPRQRSCEPPHRIVRPRDPTALDQSIRD